MMVRRANGPPSKAYSDRRKEALAAPPLPPPVSDPGPSSHRQGLAVRVVERITGTARDYVLTGTVSRDERGRYVAHAKTYLLTAGRLSRPLRSVATERASGPDIEAAGASAPEARTRLCVEARDRLGTTVTSFVWRPVLVLVSAQ